MRLRDAGIPMGHLGTGLNNAITDVLGVKVGHKTVIRGESRQNETEGIARTGITIVSPRDDVWENPVYAGVSVLNGNGEMTGTAWIEESGFLTTPVGLTNTHSVGVVRDSLIKYLKTNINGSSIWSLPVVAETWDGYLSDINGMHITEEDVFEAIENLHDGNVKEGSVGGGTGMTCFEFNGGIGTSSRQFRHKGKMYNIGVLVQANFGLRHQLTFQGLPLGLEISTSDIPGREDKKHPDIQSPRDETGSIIVLVATDIPLLADQCKRLARRVGLGLARTGSIGANNSGDIFLAFSTGNNCPGIIDDIDEAIFPVSTISPDAMSDVFDAAIEATEESVFNAITTSSEIDGILGRKMYPLPVKRVQDLYEKHKGILTHARHGTK